MLIRLLLIIVAVIISGLGISLYMTANMGIARYDAMAIIIQKGTKNKITFSFSRIITDITCVLIGFTFGAIIGVSTLITAFLTGPLVQFFRIHITDKILSHDIQKIEKESKQN